MKLYEVNQTIEEIFNQMVDTETGEIISNSNELMEQLNALQMERQRILEYLAKMVLNARSESNALKEEEARLKDRRDQLARKENRLMAILDRECAGEKTDLGVATVSYRKTERLDVVDSMAAVDWLQSHGHKNCIRILAPEINKTETKKLLKAGNEVPGVMVSDSFSCNLK